MTRRVVVLVAGLIQIFIGARFVLLLLDAREANGLVSFILNVSQVFVAPFEGILRTKLAPFAGFGCLIIAAVVGLRRAGPVLELIVIWAVGSFGANRPDPECGRSVVPKAGRV